jgi:hypothetical protein
VRGARGELSYSSESEMWAAGQEEARVGAGCGGGAGGGRKGGIKEGGNKRVYRHVRSAPSISATLSRLTPRS